MNIKCKKFFVFILSVSLVFNACLVFSFAEDSENAEYCATGLVLDDWETIEEHLEPESNISTYATLPSSVDNTSSFPTPGNQGNQGSCTAWAVGYSLKTAQEIAKRGWSKTSSSHQFSPAYIYNQLNDGSGGGIAISAAMDLVVNKGVCSLVYFPYDESDYTTSPNSLQNAAAALYKASSWTTVTGITNIKQRIANGDGVVVGIEVYPDFDNISSTNQIYDTISGTSRGKHAICLIGYDDSKGTGAFKFINSWGTSKGIGGYGWISYDLLSDSRVNMYGVSVGYVMNYSSTDNYVLGDLDSSGSVTATDARLALRYAGSLETLTHAQQALADVDGDATVSTADAQLILQYASGTLSQFPLYD
ncbi:MAG: dockerin type I domain-containing protein [Clostridiales bacterium]|nr:dockerin type I domain-containing protein [Clostridiales bacterium]